MKNESNRNSPVPGYVQECLLSKTLRRALGMLAASLMISALLSGCGTTPPPSAFTEEELTPYGSIKLSEGDTVIISFPGSPNLNTTQQIRRDGKIQLALVGEIQAAGLTPSELEKVLLEKYGPQLVLKEVTVTLQSSTYPVFVNGAVVKPGKILVDRPISALEAIMEAGGFDLARANMKAVRVVRQQEGQLKYYVLNLKSVLEGKDRRIFYARPSDIIYVPERAF